MKKPSKSIAPGWRRHQWLAGCGGGWRSVSMAKKYGGNRQKNENAESNGGENEAGNGENISQLSING
jgi:hypothetical protein